MYREDRSDQMGQELSEQEPKETKPNSKVGLSLSKCVLDILHGDVQEEEVKESLQVLVFRSLICGALF